MKIKKYEITVDACYYFFDLNRIWNEFWTEMEKITRHVNFKFKELFPIFKND